MEAEAPQSASFVVEVPLDMVRLSVDEVVLVKCRGNRELRGKLHAYDEHMNLVLGEVVEKVSTIEVDSDTMVESCKTEERTFDLLFIRGDTVILLCPPVRT